MELLSFETNPTKLGGKIGELKVKFDKARSILSTIQGVDMSHTEQLDYYQTLLKQYKRENELLASYKNMCDFDISKLDAQSTISDESSLTNTKTTKESENDEKNE